MELIKNLSKLSNMIKKNLILSPIIITGLLHYILLMIKKMIITIFLLI
jgi:hypothetical protein